MYYNNDNISIDPDPFGGRSVSGMYNIELGMDGLPSLTSGKENVASGMQLDGSAATASRSKLEP